MGPVRVRFAPSPTGYLHIGGVRTALYCSLIAKATGGKFILRIEDTDLERSKKEYETAMIEDIKWCGVDYDEGPDKDGGFGPYRQSERLQMYKDLAWSLVEQGKAYPCFLSAQELEDLTEKASRENKAPHTYHGQYRDLPLAEAKKKIEEGKEYVLRFKNPGKTYTFKDLVRGEVTFPEDMVGDFVILRSNGMPVYNFCCVIDDWKMQMSHVIRAEEHLNNTVRQLMIYEAFGVTPPVFAHCSLLVGHDRQKLSKRHGATSVKLYRDDYYLPQALTNYLCLLGWSHPEEKDIFTMDEIAPLFNLERFNKAPALYDIEKLNHFNGEHMRKLEGEDLLSYLTCALKKDHELFSLPQEKQQEAVNFFKEKVNLPSELPDHVQVLFAEKLEGSEEVAEVLSWETTGQIKNYIASELEQVSGDYVTAEVFTQWTNHIKKELKIKGKQLFKGIRVVLTTVSEGPDLKVIIPLTKVSLLKKRVL